MIYNRTNPVSNGRVLKTGYQKASSLLILLMDLTTSADKLKKVTEEYK